MGSGVTKRRSKTINCLFPTPTTNVEAVLTPTDVFSKISGVLGEKMESWRAPSLDEYGKVKVMKEAKRHVDVISMAHNRKVNLTGLRKFLLTNVGLGHMSQMAHFFSDYGYDGLIAPKDLSLAFRNETDSLTNSMVFLAPFHAMITQRYNKMNVYEFVISLERICLMTSEEICQVLFGLIYMISLPTYISFLRKSEHFQKIVPKKLKDGFSVVSFVKILNTKDSKLFEKYFQSLDDMMINIDSFEKNFRLWKRVMQFECLQDNQFVQELQTKFSDTPLTIDFFMEYAQKSKLLNFLSTHMLKFWRDRFGGESYWMTLRHKLMSNSEEGNFLKAHVAPRLENLLGKKSQALLTTLNKITKPLPAYLKEQEVNNPDENSSDSSDFEDVSEDLSDASDTEETNTKFNTVGTKTTEAHTSQISTSPVKSFAEKRDRTKSYTAGVSNRKRRKSINSVEGGNSESQDKETSNKKSKKTKSKKKTKKKKKNKASQSLILPDIIKPRRGSIKSPGLAQRRMSNLVTASKYERPISPETPSPQKGRRNSAYGTLHSLASAAGPTQRRNSMSAIGGTKISTPSKGTRSSGLSGIPSLIPSQGGNLNGAGRRYSVSKNAGKRRGSFGYG